MMVIMSLCVIFRLGKIMMQLEKKNKRKTRLKTSIHAGITIATESFSSDNTHVLSISSDTQTESINTLV